MPSYSSSSPTPSSRLPPESASSASSVDSSSSTASRTCRPRVAVTSSCRPRLSVSRAGSRSPGATPVNRARSSKATNAWNVSGSSLHSPASQTAAPVVPPTGAQTTAHQRPSVTSPTGTSRARSRVASRSTGLAVQPPADVRVSGCTPYAVVIPSSRQGCSGSSGSSAARVSSALWKAKSARSRTRCSGTGCASASGTSVRRSRCCRQSSAWHSTASTVAACAAGPRSSRSATAARTRLRGSAGTSGSPAGKTRSTTGRVRKGPLRCNRSSQPCRSRGREVRRRGGRVTRPPHRPPPRTGRPAHGHPGSGRGAGRARSRGRCPGPRAGSARPGGHGRTAGAPRPRGRRA